MTFKKVCKVEDLWEGDMEAFEVDGHEVLVVWPDGGEICAYQGICPHQDIPLGEGKFDGKVVVCRAHSWTFDAKTGKGLNPSDCSLARYPVRIEGEDILVETAGVQVLSAHS